MPSATPLSLTFTVALLLLVISHLIPVPGLATAEPKCQQLSSSGYSVLLHVTKRYKDLVSVLHAVKHVPHVS